NLDVIKTADWIIDMGPEGGHKGGTVVATGTPEELAEVPESHTGAFLRRAFGLDGAPTGGSLAVARAATANGSTKTAGPKSRTPARRRPTARASR
ncbi:MAG TPA: hypothetical protein VHI50_12335, partial [Micromonosporaceae bacterium]|nr:hypothetical protein [Micromonosporaceae bacterium]